MVNLYDLGEVMDRYERRIDRLEEALFNVEEMLRDRCIWWWEQHGRDYFDYVNGDDKWLEAAKLVDVDFSRLEIKQGKDKSNANA